MTTAEQTVFAPAKVNLSLHVTGRRADGYHLLDSLVAFADLGDMLALTPGDAMALTVAGPFADGVPTDARNLVWQAAAAMHWTGQIHLDKRLPHGAGIGGGSSDAAAILRLLGGDARAALALGADVPVCLFGRAARMRGIGEVVTPVDLPPLPAVLVNPGVPVPTGQVFQRLATPDNPAMPDTIPDFTDATDCASWLTHQRNDLEIPALGVAREIETVLGALNCTSNVQLARMSGSGATCFALYPSLNAAEFAAVEISGAHPDWWCQAVTLS